jgi:RNA polymerase sigma-70 factor (ECF subfamily)
LAVARRVVANQLRRQRRAGALVHKLGLGLGFGGAPDVAESVMASDAAYRVLAKLRPSDREVLLMALAAPLTGAELGLALGCSAKTAGVRLSRARSRLNQAVAELEAPTKVSDDTFVGVPTVPSGRVCARGSLAPTVSTRTEPVVQQVPRPDRSSSPVPMTTANVRSTP